MKRSLSGAANVTPSASPRGMIETFRTGSAPSVSMPDDRVPAFVVGRAAPVLLAHHHLALGAEHDPLERIGEVGLLDRFVASARGQRAPPR